MQYIASTLKRRCLNGAYPLGTNLIKNAGERTGGDTSTEFILYKYGYIQGLLSETDLDDKSR